MRIVKWAERGIGRLPELGVQEERRRAAARRVCAERGQQLVYRLGEALSVLSLGGRVVDMQQLPIGSIVHRVELPECGDDRQRGLLEPPQIVPESVVDCIWPQQGLQFGE